MYKSWTAKSHDLTFEWVIKNSKRWTVRLPSTKSKNPNCKFCSKVFSIFFSVFLRKFFLTLRFSLAQLRKERSAEAARNRRNKENKEYDHVKKAKRVGKFLTLTKNRYKVNFIFCKEIQIQQKFLAVWFSSK